MASTFKQFIYASTATKYETYDKSSHNDGDVAFVGGATAFDTTATVVDGSGIYTHGFFFPTPYQKSQLYNKTEIDDKLKTIDTTISNVVTKSMIGAASGVAGLDANKKVATANLPSSIVYTGSDGKIPSSALPSYVDDVKDI